MTDKQRIAQTTGPCIRNNRIVSTIDENCENAVPHSYRIILSNVERLLKYYFLSTSQIPTTFAGLKKYSQRTI